MLAELALNLPWLLFLGLLSWAYVHAFRLSRRLPQSVPHPYWRLAAFHLGLLVLAVTFLSPIEYWGNRVLWVNFLGFLLLTMLAPPLIILGSPLTLAFRVSGPDGRRALRRFYRSRLVRAVTFPVASWLLFAVATYVWQFTALTDDAARQLWVRDIQHATLLAVSLVFWLPALCSDPLRWRMPYPLRALYVFVEMTHKALFGAMFLSMSHPFHHYYANNLPGWAPSPMMDQRIGILILWIGGNMIFLLVLVGIIAKWISYEQRNQHRVDWRLGLAREAALRKRAALEQVFQKPI